MGLRSRVAAGVIGLLVAAAGLALLGLVLLGRLRDFNPMLALGCAAKPVPDPTWPPPAIVVACLLAFGVGRTIAYARERRNQPGPPPPAAARVVVQAVLVGFLGLVAGLLYYETVALSDTSVHAPITWYVRCAASVAPGWALLGATVTSLLAGHWLWYARL